MFNWECCKISFHHSCLKHFRNWYEFVNVLAHLIYSTESFMLNRLTSLDSFFTYQILHNKITYTNMITRVDNKEKNIENEEDDDDQKVMIIFVESTTTELAIKI